MQTNQQESGSFYLHHEVCILMLMLSAPMAKTIASQAIRPALSILAPWLAPKARRLLKPHICNLIRSIMPPVVARLAPPRAAPQITQLLDYLAPHASEYLAIPASQILFYLASQLMPQPESESESESQKISSTENLATAQNNKLKPADLNPEQLQLKDVAIFCTALSMIIILYIISRENRVFTNNKQAFPETYQSAEQEFSNDAARQTSQAQDRQATEAQARQAAARQAAARQAAARQAAARQAAEEQRAREAEATRKANEDAQAAQADQQALQAKSTTQTSWGGKGLPFNKQKF